MSWERAEGQGEITEMTKKTEAYFRIESDSLADVCLTKY
jgi:hypothetical protein